MCQNDVAGLTQTIKRLESMYASPPNPSAPKKTHDQFKSEKKEFEKDKNAYAEKFLAKIDIVKDIFAEDTKVARDNLVFVPQPEFHIDMHMRPLGPGQVMVNDFDANIKLVDEALKKAPAGSWQEAELKSMRLHAEEMKKVMGPVMDEIKKQVKAGGLEVVSAPGVMESQFEDVKITPSTVVVHIPSEHLGGRPPIVLEAGSFLGVTSDKEMTREQLGKLMLSKAGPHKDDLRPYFDEQLDHIFTRHVNFMNAIPGTKSGTNEQFYMTNATSVGPLKDVYEDYMKERGVEKVLWMGDDGGGDERRTSAEQSLDLMGGLDCRENH